MTPRSGIKFAPPPVISTSPPTSLRARVTITISALFLPPDLVRARQARQAGNVSGAGVVVAVLDSGCRASHVALSMSSNVASSRVLQGRNFTKAVPDEDTTDGTGHGTAISGLVAARSFAPLVAPDARILPLKIFSDEENSDFSFMLDGLSWVIDHGLDQGVSVVCLSMGDSGNWPSFEAVPNDGGGIRQQIAEKIRTLRQLGIPTVAAAGNGFRANGVTAGTGMCFPAIMPECISVGATFNGSLAPHVFDEYGGASTTDTSKPGQLTPFTQRLPRADNNPHFTRLFAPGAPLQSIGKESDTSQTGSLYGTSVAVPVVAGVIALMQEWHKKHRNGLPSCDKLEQWLLQGADSIVDDAGDRDNVDNTGATFSLANALGSVQAMMSDGPMA